MKGGERPHLFLDARKAADFGIGRYVTGLLRALDRAGEFDLTALVRPGAEAALPRGVRAIRSDAPNYSLSELVAVRRAFARSGATLLHAPHYVVPLLPPPATVVTIHDLIHLTRPEHDTFLRRAYARRMLRRAVKAAGKVLTVSAAVAKDLEAFFPGAADKTVVVPNGVDERFFEPVGNEELARFTAGRHLGPRWLLFLGNDKPHKNLDGLLAAFALLAASGTDPVQLVLAGGAPGRREDRAGKIAALGLAGLVVDAGVVPDEEVRLLVGGASALVLPSFDEGFGIPVLEAQALGTPVVCSDRGGLQEAAGGAAILVDPASIEELSSAMARILSDEPLRARLAAAGRIRARAFTWDAAAARTAAVYREVLERERRGSTGG